MEYHREKSSILRNGTERESEGWNGPEEDKLGELTWSQMARKRMAMGTIPGALEEDERLVELKVDSLKKDSRDTLGGNNPWGSGVNAQGL